MADDHPAAQPDAQDLTASGRAGSVDGPWRGGEVAIATTPQDEAMAGRRADTIRRQPADNLAAAPSRQTPAPLCDDAAPLSADARFGAGRKATAASRRRAVEASRPPAGSGASAGGPALQPAPEQPYSARRLSYATTFDSPARAATIRALEWLTGKMTLLAMVRRFERMGVPDGQAFWSRALSILDIELQTPEAQVGRIPATGPVVIVANHPHGLVDGMVLAELIGRVRQDYKILTRSLLTGVEQVARFLIPVPFQHDADALQQNLAMRRQAMAHLSEGGVIVLFPSGVVASATTAFGPAVEADWNPFTAKMIQKSRATVLPVYFPGQNSRWYQIANRISPTLRQGLLIHEVIHARGRAQAPVIGAPIGPEVIGRWADDPRGFVRWLRQCTLSLGATGDDRHGQVMPGEMGQRVGVGVWPE